MLKKLNRLWIKMQTGMMELNNKKGQSMIEYVLILVLIVIAVVAVLGLVSGKLQEAFQKVVEALTFTTGS